MAYWNKEIECMPQEELKKLQLDLLQKLIKRLYKGRIKEALKKLH